MSSIVRKKQTQFVPKIKKATRRRKISQSHDGQLTPQPTQEAAADTSGVNVAHKSSSPLTPGPTQVSFYTGTTEKRLEKSPEEVVDPMDKSRTIVESAIDDEDEEEEDDEYGDNDIFKAPLVEKPSRSASVSHVRLSGIANRRKSFARSASLSDHRASFGEKEVLIQVPLSGRPVTYKSRRPSTLHVTGQRPSMDSAVSDDRHGSAVSIVSDVGSGRDVSFVDESEAARRASEAAAGTGGEMTVVAAETEDAADESTDEYVPDKNEVSRDELFQSGKYIIYALNKKRDKLVKYRTGPLPEDVEVEHRERMLAQLTSKSKTASSIDEKWYEIPLAPEKVVMKVSKLSEIPRRILQNDVMLSQDIELDPETFTMKDLCNPLLPVGSTSSNFELVQEAKNREKKAARLRKLARKTAKESKISYEAALEIVEREQENMEEGSIKKGEDSDADDTPQKQEIEEQYQEKKEAGTERKVSDAYDALNIGQNRGLQLNITDGKLEVDAESTVVHRSNYENSQRTREETNPFERPVISNTYSKRRHTDKWDSQEELEFFSALSTWGTDFSMISEIFPHRTRKQVKTKFNLEEKKRPELVDLALKRKFQVDIDEYESKTGKKIGTLSEFEEARKRIRIEHEQQKKEILKEQERAKLEDTEKNRRREIERRSGQKPIERLTKNKTLRSNEEVVGTLDRR